MISHQSRAALIFGFLTAVDLLLAFGDFVHPAGTSLRGTSMNRFN